MEAKQFFEISQAVATMEPGYLLKGQSIRYGVVVGWCLEPDYLRVSWEGWKRTSSQAIHVTKVFRP